MLGCPMTGLGQNSPTRCWFCSCSRIPDDRVGHCVHAINRHNDECIVMIEFYFLFAEPLEDQRTESQVIVMGSSVGMLWAVVLLRQILGLHGSFVMPE